MPVEPVSACGFDPVESLKPDQNDLAKQVRDVMDRLDRAERPFIFAGNGVGVSGAAAVFEKLVRLFNVPVGLTRMAMDLLDDDDPLFVGRPGTVASRGANFALQNADFVLMIGTRLDPPLMGWDPHRFARGAYKTVVDIDPAELRKLEGAIDNPICADAHTFIDQLLEQAKSARDKNEDRTAWLQRCQDWKTRYPLVLPEHRAPGLVSLYHLAEIIGQEAGPNDRVVSGSSGSANEVSCWPTGRERGVGYFIPQDWGRWDTASPLALGCVSVAAKGRRPALTATAAFSSTSRSWPRSRTCNCLSNFSF
jgi:acetolactate synthase-1/2/3 large subunit